MLTRDEIERIRHANRIETVAGRYTQLQPAGGGKLKGLCPLHQEDSPSFFVYTEQQSWWCYGCQAGADLPGGQDLFKLLMLVEGLTFPEAVERLAAGLMPGPPAPPSRCARPVGPGVGP